MNIKGIAGFAVVLGVVNALSYFFDWGWWFY